MHSPWAEAYPAFTVIFFSFFFASADFGSVTVSTMREPKMSARQIGDPGAIRTRGPQIRNLMLYPAELRGPGRPSITATGDLHPWDRLTAGFAGR
jgi:hypothetical protein